MQNCKCPGTWEGNAPTFPPPINSTSESQLCFLPIQHSVPPVSAFRHSAFCCWGFRQKSLVPFLASPGHGREQGHHPLSRSTDSPPLPFLHGSARCGSGGGRWRRLSAARGFPSCCCGGKWGSANWETVTGGWCFSRSSRRRLFRRAVAASSYGLRRSARSSAPARGCCSTRRCSTTSCATGTRPTSGGGIASTRYWPSLAFVLRGVDCVVTSILDGVVRSDLICSQVVLMRLLLTYSCGLWLRSVLLMLDLWFSDSSVFYQFFSSEVMHLLVALNLSSTQGLTLFC